MIAQKFLFVIIACLSISSCAYAYDTYQEANWQPIEQHAQNAVVQISAQRAEFNWLEPYKAPEQQQVSGSAFFINEHGHLLTNFHLIDQAKSISINVPFLGKKILEATIIGVCPEADVALLKLDDESVELIRATRKSIPFLPLGNSDTLYRTDPVLAIGYPLGFRYQKSTIGCIAGREYLGDFSYMHITAPINPGNSGGPLLNIKGEVVGMNSAGISSAQNIGYIIPINDIKIMLDDLYFNRVYRKPTLGITCNNTTDEHTKLLHNPVPGGIYINFVHDHSVAQEAGVRMGDMLYEINYCGETYKVDSYGDVTVNWRSSDKVSVAELLIRVRLGEPISLIIYRMGTRLELSCNFNAKLAPVRTMYPDFEPEAKDYELFGGICVMQLRENHFKYFPRVPVLKEYKRAENKTNQALIITHIFAGSQIDKVQCFYPGDIIYSVNNIAVRTLAELREALMLSATTKTIALSDKYHTSTVLSLEKILQDEKRLASDFMFPISDTMCKLEQLLNKK